MDDLSCFKLFHILENEFTNKQNQRKIWTYQALFTDLYSYYVRIVWGSLQSHYTLHIMFNIRIFLHITIYIHLKKKKMQHALNNANSAQAQLRCLVYCSKHDDGESIFISEIHRSGITLWPQTGGVNTTDCLFIMTHVSGWDILGCKWTCCLQSLCVKGSKMGKLRIWVSDG